MTASESEALALDAAVRWSFAVMEQADRVVAAQNAWVTAFSEVRAKGHYDQRDAYPFYALSADRHFLLIAARQLVRALDKWGREYAKDGVDVQDIKTLRDWHEHAGEPGRAEDRYKTLSVPAGATPESHEWTTSDALLGGRIRLQALRTWAQKVHEDLLEVDVWIVG